MTGARVSLCMIVRDEAQLLPGCLASVRAAVDEVVVVDTGSRDDTPAIARQAGALVLEQPWADDFSAPRNLAINRASGDWVLVLDADERLTVAAARALRAAVAAGDFDCGLLPLHNAKRVESDLDQVVAGPERLAEVAHLPRLLRRTDDLRYTGIVHENVGEWLAARPRRVRMLRGVDIVHLGGVPDVRRKRAKAARNVALLERHRERCPDDLTPYGYLAHEYLEAGERERAREVAERGWALLCGGAPALDLSVQRLATARAWIQVQGGEPRAGLATIAHGQALIAEHPDLCFIRGCALEMLGLLAEAPEERSARLAEALGAYEQARALDGRLFLQKFVQGCTSWAAWVRIGTIALLTGRSAEATTAFARAIELDPEGREARWGRVEGLLAAGEPLGAMREVQPYLDDRPDGWVLAALGAEAAGMIEQMAQLMGRAQRCLGVGFIAPHRRERYCDALGALGIYQGADVQVPGPIGQLALLLRGRHEPVAGARARPLDQAMGKRVLGRLLGAGKTDQLIALLAPAAERLLPGVTALVEATIAELGATLARSQGGRPR